MILGAAGIGFVCGIVITALGMILFMPKMMLITHASTMGFDETVSAIEQSIARNGWTSPGTIDLCKSMQKHGVECPRRVTVVQLCHPAYSKDILTTDPQVSALMPCTVAVWEADDGSVQVSKMNTGLMARLFGGNIARVMGGKVSTDERTILEGIVE